MQPYTKISAVVIGANHHNTLGVIRALGRKGIPVCLVLVTDVDRPFVGASKYLSRLVTVGSEAEVTAVLVELDHNVPTALFSCSDKVSSILDSNRDMLESAGYVVPGTASDCGLEYWMNKDVMAGIAVKCGLHVPSCGVASFPVIAKPLKSISGTKSDISILNDVPEYESYLALHSGMEIQYQQFIEKDSEYQLIGCSLDAGKDVIIPGVSVILRQPDNTNTGYLEYRSLDGSYPIEACRKFLRTISYSGLFSMEFLRGRDGKDYFMEINLRNDGNAICVTAAGVNLPFIWYLHCIGDPWEFEASRDVVTTRVMPEFDDFRDSVLHRKVSLLRWLRDVIETDCFMEYASDDRKPFFRMTGDFFMHYLKKANRYLTNWRWELGFVQNDIKSILRGDRLDVKWVKLPFRDRWFADPWILDVTEDEIVMLCEEYSDSLHRGRIAKVVVDRHTWQFKNWKLVMNSPTHLSFPAILRKDDKIYIYPENSESGHLALYEYEPQSDGLKPLHIVSDEPLTDAVYTELFDGRKLLMSTQIPDPNGNTLDISEWNEQRQLFVKIGCIDSDDKTGRMAGGLFTIDGKIYRPAQESNAEYGHAVEIQEITCNDGKWSVIPVRRMTSTHPILKLGLHTFNIHGGITVIDVKGYRFPLIGYILKSLTGFIKKHLQ